MCQLSPAAALALLGVAMDGLQTATCAFTAPNWPIEMQQRTVANVIGRGVAVEYAIDEVKLVAAMTCKNGPPASGIEQFHNFINDNISRCGNFHRLCIWIR